MKFYIIDLARAEVTSTTNQDVALSYAVQDTCLVVDAEADCLLLGAEHTQAIKAEQPFDTAP